MNGGDGVPEISVVIAVRNDAAGLAQTLEALERQSLAAERYEVIVVDDASTDDTAALAARFDGVRLVRLAQQRGSYAARNRGLADARGRHIAITDADCRPAPEWLERGLARLAENQGAVVAGHIAMPLPPQPSLAAMVDVIHHLDQQRYVEEAGCAVTANLFAGADTFAAVGGFDERMQSSGDVEWTRRAREAGHPLIYAPEASVQHPPRAQAAALLRKARRVADGGRAARRDGILEPGRPPYLNPWCLVPWHRERGRLRLRENGADPGPLRWLAVGVAQVALVQLPQAAYALAADVRAWRRGRGRT